MDIIFEYNFEIEAMKKTNTTTPNVCRPISDFMVLDRINSHFETLSDNYGELWDWNIIYKYDLKDPLYSVSLDYEQKIIYVEEYGIILYGLLKVEALITQLLMEYVEYMQIGMVLPLKRVSLVKN